MIIIAIITIATPTVWKIIILDKIILPMPLDPPIITCCGICVRWGNKVTASLLMPGVTQWKLSSYNNSISKPGLLSPLSKLFTVSLLGPVEAAQRWIQFTLTKGSLSGGSYALVRRRKQAHSQATTSLILFHTKTPRRHPNQGTYWLHWVWSIWPRNHWASHTNWVTVYWAWHHGM